MPLKLINMSAPSSNRRMRMVSRVLELAGAGAGLMSMKAEGLLGPPPLTKAVRVMLADVPGGGRDGMKRR